MKSSSTPQSVKKLEHANFNIINNFLPLSMFLNDQAPGCKPQWLTCFYSISFLAFSSDWWVVTL